MTFEMRFRGKNLTSKAFLGAFGLTFLIGLFPATLLVAVWAHVFMSNLPGGRNGPLDAYRHMLASAYLSFALGPKSVEIVTTIMESCSKRSCQMDRNNNILGAKIGTEHSSLIDLEPAVTREIFSMKEELARSVNPEDETPSALGRPKWLASRDWGSGMFW
jgi:hypothetical protein